MITSLMREGYMLGTAGLGLGRTSLQLKFLQLVLFVAYLSVDLYQLLVPTILCSGCTERGFVSAVDILNTLVRVSHHGMDALVQLGNVFIHKFYGRVSIYQG